MEKIASLRRRSALRAGQPIAVLAAVVASLALVGCSAGSVGTTSAPESLPLTEAAEWTEIDLSPEFAALEAQYSARVGVSVYNTETGAVIEHRADERFGYASTLKAFAAAEFLRRVPVGERDDVVTWTAEDVETSGYSSVTGEHIAEGLPLSTLAEAAVRDSDNTAMNLVLKRIGGPTALGEGLRLLDDSISRVVNNEPALNVIAPDSTDDTTTPAAFTGNLVGVLEGDFLTARDRSTLIEWMSGNATGDALVRAGAPEGWDVADKSGGAGAIRNDIAVVTPPGRSPILMTVLTEKLDPDAPFEDALVADVAGAVFARLG